MNVKFLGSDILYNKDISVISDGWISIFSPDFIQVTTGTWDVDGKIHSELDAIWGDRYIDIIKSGTSWVGWRPSKIRITYDTLNYMPYLQFSDDDQTLASYAEPSLYAATIDWAGGTGNDAVMINIGSDYPMCPRNITGEITTVSNMSFTNNQWVSADESPVLFSFPTVGTFRKLKIEVTEGTVLSTYWCDSLGNELVNGGVDWSGYPTLTKPMFFYNYVFDNPTEPIANKLKINHTGILKISNISYGITGDNYDDIVLTNIEYLP
jgi:hypothetical protein